MKRSLFGVLVGLSLLIATPHLAQGQQAATPVETAPAEAAPAQVQFRNSAALRARIAERPAVTFQRDTEVVAAQPEAPAAAQVVERARAGEIYFARTTAVEDATLLSALRPSLAAALNTDVASVSDPETFVAMPGVIRQLANDGTEVQLKPFMHVGRELRRDSATGLFVGAIQVGLVDLAGGAGASRDLSAPVPFQVLESDRADPVQFSLQQTSPHFTEVKISVHSVSEEVAVSVASPYNPEGTRIVMSVAPMLDISTDSLTIEGLGLELADINVSVIGLDGVEGRSVTLRATPAAYFTASTLTLDANGNASTQLRSRGVGASTITAQITGMEPASTQIEFGLPFLTVGASLLGGLVGGALRALTSGGGRLMGQLVIGMLTGTLVFALYAIGVNVLPVTPVVEVGSVFVFAVSGLGAFLGDALLKPRTS